MRTGLTQRRWGRAGAGICALALAAAVAAGPAGGRLARAATGSPCGRVTKAPAYTHIVVIAFENHSSREVLGSSAPSSFFKTLAGECGLATDFRASSFPHSLPNYLAATSGTIAGITGDCLPKGKCRSPAGSIFGQLGPGGWVSWSESMPSACDRSNASPYVPRHNPAVYLTAIPAAACTADDIPLPAAPAITRSFTWITPNLADDMTKGTPATAGAWLQRFLTGSNGLLQRAPYTTGNTAVFIWFDTAADTDSLSSPIPLIVISPSTPAGTVSAPLGDAALLRTWESMLGLPCINGACGAVNARADFNL